MERYNLTDLTMRKLRDICIAGPYRERVIEYFLYNNFVQVLGNNVLSSDDGEITTKKERPVPVLEVTSIFSDPITIKITSVNNETAIITASTEKNTLFTISIGNYQVSNDTTFYQGDLYVHETQDVAFDNKDASEFRLFRAEDGEIVYDGKLTPLLAVYGEDEYFDFKSAMEPEKKEENSFLKKIYDSLTEKTTVRVTTTKEIHDLVDYVDSIYDALRTRLESTRVVKDVKVRKRVPDKKNKND
jgi:hypothetical protein